MILQHGHSAGNRRHIVTQAKLLHMEEIQHRTQCLCGYFAFRLSPLRNRDKLLKHRLMSFKSGKVHPYMKLLGERRTLFPASDR